MACSHSICVTGFITVNSAITLSADTFFKQQVNKAVNPVVCIIQVNMQLMLVAYKFDKGFMCLPCACSPAFRII